MYDPEGMTAQERAAVVSWDLAGGARFTTAQVARRLGLSMRGARCLLARISRVVPIYCDECGRWQAVGSNRAPASDKLEA